MSVKLVEFSIRSIRIAGTKLVECPYCFALCFKDNYPLHSSKMHGTETQWLS